MPRFKKFNFFIGANNAGKSSVLNFASKYLGSSNASAKIDSLEYHVGRNPGSPAFAIGIPIEEFRKNAREAISDDHARANAGLRPTVDRLVDVLADDGTVWLKNTIPAKTFTYLRSLDEEVFKAAVPARQWYPVWSAITGSSQGEFSQHWFPQTLTALLNVQPTKLPDCILIPAIRQIGKKGEDFSDYTGAGLIDRLAQIQSPGYDSREDRDLFDQVNKFLQVVTGHSEAVIEVPHHRDHLLVHINGRVLPLISLGTGIHEVIMIAAFCTINQDKIICIEEPEIHLHPLLQRKLVSYLNDNTNNQYIIATHSASFIDTPGAAIFHVSIDDDQTIIRESILRKDKYAICLDLGHRASDIIQANSAIWVEGPSDRIYLNHWIKAAAPDLIEGTHYAVMFYGGRMLSHLSADDEEIQDFISLKGLNQNSAVIMDSDKASAHAAVNQTKKRIESEFAKGRGISWMTKGREIENYVPHAKLQAAVREVYSSSYVRAREGGQFEHALHFVRRKRIDSTKRTLHDVVETQVDKVKVAKKVCEGHADLDVLDLRRRIGALVAMIREANEG